MNEVLGRQIEILKAKSPVLKDCLDAERVNGGTYITTTMESLIDNTMDMLASMLGEH